MKTTEENRESGDSSENEEQEEHSRPGPRVMTDAALSDFLGQRQFGTLATIRRDGHPHLTTMIYHWDPAERIVRFSSTADRIKVGQIRSNPLTALHVSSDDHWTFATAEGEAEVSEPSTAPGDAVGRELLMLLPPALRPEGSTEDAAFLELQVAERRVVIRLRVGRLYGTALDITT